MSATQALRTLRRSEASGNLSERQSGIRLGLAEWSQGAVSPGLRLYLARALSAQYRTTYDLSLLTTALQVLTRDPIRAREGGAAELLAQYADVLLQVGIQLQVRAVPEESTAAQNAAGLLNRTAIVAARWACRLEPPGQPGNAEGLAALGAAYSQLGILADAIPVLRAAVASDPTNASAWLALATGLASLTPDTGGEAAWILSAIADAFAVSRPRDAFEAARVHGFWAQQRQAWGEAGRAYTQALSVRTRVRGAQDSYLSARAWLSESGAIPSQAFCSFVRSGELDMALDVLDAGLALNLSDRLELPTVVGTPVRPRPAPRTGENFLLLAFDQHGGAALRVSPARQLDAVELPQASRSALAERLLPYVTAYGMWLRDRSPLRRREWVTELTGILDWVGAAVLELAVQLVDDDCSALMLVTDGHLSLLPLAAGPVDGTPLLDRFAVSSSPNLRMLAAARTHAPPRPVRTLTVAASDTADTPGLPNLPYATLESHAVARLCGNAVCAAGPDATAARVIREMATYNVVHVASHARFDPNQAMASYIQLSDDKLDLTRILALDLSGVCLFVASACETAMADVGIPEEMHSLAGGLLHAGVSGVAATLWAVGDRASMVLSLKFHELLLDAPADGAAQALRCAQLWLRDSTHSDLVSWATKLAPRLPDTNLASSLTGLFPSGGSARPFAQPVDWASFTYFGA